MKKKLDLTNILEDARPDNYHELALDCSWDEYFKVISSRRSIRVFDQTPVPASVIRNAIDAGLIAPNLPRTFGVDQSIHSIEII